MEFLYQRTKTADLKRVAKERGGECLSKKYTGMYDKYEWKCKRGHTWTTNFYSIYTGSWCSQCFNIERVQKSVKKIVDFAKANGGKCLTPDIESDEKMVKLQCAKGHKWEIRPTLAAAKLWCPTCGKPSNLK